MLLHQLLPRFSGYKGPCLVEGCNRISRHRGVCNPCYQRVRSRGTTDRYEYSRQECLKKFYRKCKADVKTGCINWTGYRCALGYGVFGLNAKLNKAHRVAWMFKYGPIPDGLCILHKCDNPSCVNTKHLFIGTKADNNRDKMEKGRHRCRRKLTVQQAKYILKTKVSRIVLSKRFNISKNQITAIRKGRAWLGLTREKEKK